MCVCCNYWPHYSSDGFKANVLNWRNLKLIEIVELKIDHFLPVKFRVRIRFEFLPRVSSPYWKSMCTERKTQLVFQWSNAPFLHFQHR